MYASIIANPGITLILVGLGIALVTILMPKALSWTRRYTQSGLQPVYFPERARTLAIKLAPGTYAAGTTLGQVANITPRNDVQNVTVGNANGGNFGLSFGGATISLAYNANAAVACSTLDAALIVALGNAAGSSVSCVQNSTGNFSFTFGGNLANSPQAALSVNNGNLTGTGANVTTLHPIVGQYAGGGYATYTSGNTDGTGQAVGLLQYTTIVDALGNHYVGGGEWGESHTTAPMYMSGYFRTADCTGLDSTAIAAMGRLVSGNLANLTNLGAVVQIGGA